MLPFRLNRNLLLLALAGVLMYFGVMAWNALAGGGGVDEEMGRPPVTEEAAQAAASAWAARQFPGFTPGNSSVTYQNDKSMSAYVEKNDLTAEYKKTLSGKVPLDYWQVEIREQNGSRQLSVRVGMEQAVVTGWKTTGPRTGPAASDRTQADQALASAGYEPARFTPVPEKQKTPGNFVYQGKDTAVGEARLVLNVEVGGSEALSLLPSFELPDAFTGYMDKQSRSTKWMLGGSLFLPLCLGWPLSSTRSAAARKSPSPGASC
ncbi:hypothetical protein N6H14_17755 [Paenibacillus sp. CC-CFT747]|nr:hypothetical protein N6H14_17755 [Paenibacillus sp. CC-CFT747]